MNDSKNLMIQEIPDKKTFKALLIHYIKRYQVRVEATPTLFFYNKYFELLDEVPETLRPILDTDLASAHFVLSSEEGDWNPSVNTVYNFQFMK